MTAPELDRATAEEEVAAFYQSDVQGNLDQGFSQEESEANALDNTRHTFRHLSPDWVIACCG